MNPLDAPQSAPRPAAPPAASPATNPPTNEPQAVSEFRPEDAAAAVARLEKLLRDVRGALESREREREHREFSIILLLGLMAQMAALGVLAWGLIDWILLPLFDKALVKFVLAGVLQLMAMTAFDRSKIRS